MACSVQAHPFHVEFGVGLTRSAPLGLEKDIHIKCHLTLEHRIDRPAEFMSQDAQGFSFAMLFLQAGQKVLTLGVVAQKERGGFRKGPLEVSMADFFA
jgi:hypothetical protein